jgi:PST family polysaccharide transporter
MADAVRAVPWTFLSYGVTKAISVATTLVLARLLVPADFGVVALASLVIGGLAVVRELGLGATYVVRQDLDRRGEGTVLTLMLTSNTLVAAATAAAAPLVGLVFDDPRLSGVLAALCIGLVLAGPGNFYTTLLQRELRFRARFFTDLAQSVAYAAVAIAAAAAGAGVWSLVIGQVVASVTFTLTLLLAAPYRVRPAFDRGQAAPLVREGTQFIAQGGLSYAQQNADYFAAGVALSPTQVGFYSMSYRLAELPYLAIADPVASVTFPAFARRRHEGRPVAAAFLTALKLVALVTVPLGIVLSAAARPFTEVMLGDQWLPMVGALSVLGLLAGLRTVHVTIAWFLNSVGQAAMMSRVSAATLVPLVPALLLAAELEGIRGIAWVMVADVAVAVALLAWVSARRAAVPLRDQLAALRGVAAGAAVGWGAGRAAVALLEDAPALAELAGAAAAVGCAYAATVALVDRDALPELWRQGARALGRGGAAAAQARPAEAP